MVADEGTHGHGIAADNTDRAGRGSGGLAGQNRAYKDAVGPIAGLVDQRSGLGAAAAEDDGGDRNAIGILILGREAGAIVAGRGEAAIGMGAGGAVAAVPGLTLPIERVLGRILIQLLPPDSVIIQVLHHIGEDGILAGGGQGVGVALGIGTGRYAKEAVLGIDSPKRSQAISSPTHQAL